MFMQVHLEMQHTNPHLFCEHPQTHTHTHGQCPLENQTAMWMGFFFLKHTQFLICFFGQSSSIFLVFLDACRTSSCCFPASKRAWGPEWWWWCVCGGGGGCHRDCTAVCVLCTPPCITWTQPRQISGFFVHLNVLWRTEIICNDFLLH